MTYSRSVLPTKRYTADLASAFEISELPWESTSRIRPAWGIVSPVLMEEVQNGVLRKGRKADAAESLMPGN